MRKLLMVTTTILVLVALYTAWVFYARWYSTRKAHQREIEKQAADARIVLNKYGGDRLTILSLTMNPAEINPGQKATLCYGVSNAKSVRFEPPIGDVWPSMSNCLEVKARRDTIFKLIAEDAAGHIETATVPLRVR